MTAITHSDPGPLIRWDYLGYSALALGLMTAAIASGGHWFLNFVHVMSGVLWTGIDLFMGFVDRPDPAELSILRCGARSSCGWCRKRCS